MVDRDVCKLVSAHIARIIQVWIANVPKNLEFNLYYCLFNKKLKQMPPLQMSAQMTSGRSITSAIVANQLYELPDRTHDTEIQYYSESGLPTSSPFLTFDGSNFQVVGNLRVSEGMSIGYENVLGETYHGFEIRTNDPNHIFLDAQNMTPELTNDYSYRFAFSKGDTSANGSSSLEFQGGKTTFFMPIRAQPPGAPPTPGFYADFGSRQAVPGVNQYNPVTFHVQFVTPPKVFVTLYDNTETGVFDQSDVCPYILDLTVTGCRIQLYGGIPDFPVTANTIIQWTAIGGV